MLTRHAIQVLRQAGHAQSEDAEITGVSIREERRIEKEPAIEETRNPADSEPQKRDELSVKLAAMQETIETCIDGRR